MSELREAGRSLDAEVVIALGIVSNPITVYAWTDRKDRKYPLIGFQEGPWTDLGRKDFGVYVNEAGDKLPRGVWFPAEASTSISAAFEVVAQMRHEGWLFDLSEQPPVSWLARFSINEREAPEHGNSIPLAICLAALAAIENSDPALVRDSLEHLIGGSA